MCLYCLSGYGGICAHHLVGGGMIGAMVGFELAASRTGSHILRASRGNFLLRQVLFPVPPLPSFPLGNVLVLSLRLWWDLHPSLGGGRDDRGYGRI